MLELQVLHSLAGSCAPSATQALATRQPAWRTCKPLRLFVADIQGAAQTVVGAGEVGCPQRPGGRALLGVAEEGRDSADCWRRLGK